MSDLHVIATITAKPEAVSEVRAALTALVAATKADEEACLSYDLLESTETPGEFFTLERWTSKEGLDAHMKTPHFNAAMAAAGDHLAGAPAIHTLSPVA